MGGMRIGLENAFNASGIAIRKSYSTATPSQATGYEATYTLDESPSTKWRSGDLSYSNTHLLYRLGALRYGQIFAGACHNLSPSATWSIVADDEYATRPAWESDGSTAGGATTATIPPSADVTLLARLWIHHQPATNEASGLRLLEIGNGAGNRFELIFDTGVSATQFKLFARIANWGTVANSTRVYEVVPGSIDLALRYTDATDTLEMIVDGELITSIVAATSWSDNGDEALYVSQNRAGANKSAATWQDVRYVGRALSDAEISAYRAEVQTGTERDLLGSWHFLSGTTTVVDTTSNGSNMTLTGGSWRQRANPKPRCESGELQLYGPWQSRSHLALSPGTYATSPVLGTALRSVTLAGSLLISSDAALVTDGSLCWYGPSLAAAQLYVATNPDGTIYAGTTRGGVATVTSLGALDDDVPHSFNAVLDGQQETLELYVDGVLQGSTSIGAMSAVANCKLEVGDSTATSEATVAIGDVRLYRTLWYGDVLDGDTGGHDYDLVAHLRLDAQVVDLVDRTRSYTTASLAYVTLYRDVDGALAQMDDRRVEDPTVHYTPYLYFACPARIQLTELLLRVYDGSNPDGYVQLGVAAMLDGFTPTYGRGWTLRREPHPVESDRSIDGLAYLMRGYDHDVWSVSCPYLITDAGTGKLPGHTDEVDELVHRLGRRGSSGLIVMCASTLIERPRLNEHVIVGTATLDQGFVETVRGPLSGVAMKITSLRRG